MASKSRAFCQFKKPAKFNDLLTVELAIEELKERAVKYTFKIFNKKTEVLLANGHVAVVVANKQTGKTSPMPKEIAEKLKPFCK